MQTSESPNHRDDGLSPIAGTAASIAPRGCPGRPSSFLWTAGWKNRALSGLIATSEGRKPFACVLWLDDPSIHRLPGVGGQERSIMAVAIEDLDAKVREVEVDDIHATLVPVEQTYAAI
jgi:hypothetical protein